MFHSRRCINAYDVYSHICIICFTFGMGTMCVIRECTPRMWPEEVFASVCAYAHAEGRVRASELCGRARARGGSLYN